MPAHHSPWLASALFGSLSACSPIAGLPRPGDSDGGTSPISDVAALAPGAAPTADSRLQACQDGDAFYCSAHALSQSAWRGDGGPFADLVFSATACSDVGYCFFGHLGDGARIDGVYYVRPETLAMEWRDGAFVALAPEVAGATLGLFRYGLDEEHPVLVERLALAPSICDTAADCVDQATPLDACPTVTARCAAHVCSRSCL